MTYRIIETCVKCGACFYECPTGAIYEDDTQYRIDPEKCTGCGACQQLYCPGWALGPAPA